MTSPDVVEKMIKRIPREVLADPKANFCDPVCGKGTFLLRLFVEMFDALDGVIHDERARAKSIVSRIHGYDADESQARTAVSLLLMMTKPFGIVKDDLENVKCVDSLKLDCDMKRFDVIVGNPPFQINTVAVDANGSSGSRNPIWHKFVELAFKLTNDDGHIIFVTPNGWRQGNFRKGPFTEAQRLMWKECTIIWYEDAKDGFPNIGNITTIDAWHIRKGQHETDLPQKALTKVMVLPRDRSASSIFTKFFDVCESNIPFERIKDHDGRDAATERSASHPYKHVNTAAWTKANRYQWFAKKTDGFDDDKVVMARSNDPFPFYSPGGECGTGSSAYGFKVNGRKEGEALVNFLTCALPKFIVSSLGSNEKGYPVQIFFRLPKLLATTPWQQVFGFTEDELKLIESSTADKKKGNKAA